MKKAFLLGSVLAATCLSAQTAGINTTAPTATLEVVNPNYTSTPKYLRLLNTNSQEYLTVTNTGVGLNRNNDSTPLSLDILVPATPPVGMTLRVVNGTSYFGHAFNALGDATYDQASATVLNRDQGLYFSIDNDPKGGLFLGPRSDKATGLFIGENGLNAVYSQTANPVLAAH